MTHTITPGSCSCLPRAGPEVDHMICMYTRALSIGALFVPRCGLVQS